jgi:NAD+ synthase
MIRRREYFIEPEKCIENIVDWIKNYFADFEPNTKAIIGMSGGKDSTVAAALLVRALGPDRVIGAIMPNITPQAPLDTTSQFTIEICESLGIQHYVLPIGDIVSSLYLALPSYVMSEEGVYNNTPPRVRMSVLYGLAAATHGRVVNTCNKSETYVGWETKWGDNTGDFSIFANYLATQVVEIGLAMPELREGWVKRVPDDGLCGATDEEKFGFTYKELDAYILNNVIPEDVSVLHRIKKMYKAAAHKRRSVSLPAPSAKLVWNENVEFYECVGEDWF